MKLRFTVRDNGVGMSEDFLEHLYDPFSQEHSQLSGIVKGMGLGLPIVKNLVDAMGGTITVQSKLNEGMNAHLSKPIDPPLLYAALEKYIRR